MILSINERLYLADLFAANKDSYSEAMIQKSIIKKVSLGRQEQIDICFKQAGAGFIWDSKKGLDKDFDFSETQIAYMRESAFNLSRSKDFGVTQDILSVVTKLYTA